MGKTQYGTLPEVHKKHRIYSYLLDSVLPSYKINLFYFYHIGNILILFSLTIPNFTFGNISYKSDKVILNALNYTCNSGITGTATLSKGNSTNFARIMNNGQPDSDTLKYNIFIPGNNTPIGDGTDGSRTLTLNGTGKEELMWISGSVLRNQYIRPGNYSDNLTLTVTY